MNFTTNSDSLRKYAKNVIVDYRTDKRSISTLENMGINVILSCEINSLYDAVRGHPDMVIHRLCAGTFAVAPEAYDYFKERLPNAKLIKGSKCLSDKYPDDIAYNAAALGDFAICKSDFTSEEILEFYKDIGKKILNVNQGYSKCSICIVSDNAIITADKGIYETAKGSGIDTLKIREGHIILPGVSYGFVGGATGLISKNLLAVNGDIKTHPDYREIYDFCKKHDVEILSLKEGELEDIGSIIADF